MTIRVLSLLALDCITRQTMQGSYLRQRPTTRTRRGRHYGIILTGLTTTRNQKSTRQTTNIFTKDKFRSSEPDKRERKADREDHNEEIDRIGESCGDVPPSFPRPILGPRAPPYPSLSLLEVRQSRTAFLCFIRIGILRTKGGSHATLRSGSFQVDGRDFRVKLNEHEKPSRLSPQTETTSCQCPSLAAYNLSPLELPMLG